MSKRSGPRPDKRRFPDPIDHERFIAWHRARVQARFRDEPWDLTVEDWFQLWTKAKWAKRGRGRDDLCMIRKDHTLSWCVGNVKVVSRLFQLRMYARLRKIRNAQSL